MNRKTFLEAGRKSLDETKRSLKALDDHAEKISDRDLKEKADNAQAKVGEYEVLGNETVSENEALANVRGQLEEVARKFMDNCNGFLNDQNEALKSEISRSAERSELLESHEEISLIKEDRHGWTPIKD